MNAIDDASDVHKRLMRVEAAVTRIEAMLTTVATREDLVRLEMRMGEKLRSQMKWVIGILIAFWMAGAALMSFVVRSALEERGIPQPLQVQIVAPSKPASPP